MRRSAWWMILLLFLSTSLVPVHGQSDTEMELLTDEAGDQSWYVQDNAVPADSNPELDLLAFRMDEVEDDHTFMFEIESSGAPDPANDPVGLDYVRNWIHFTWDSRQFAVVFEWFEDDGTLYDYATMREYDPQFDYYGWIGYAQAERDDNNVRVYMDKKILTDRDGAPPQEGDQFTDIWAEAASVYLSMGEPVVQQHDRMPDTGVAADSWTVLYGPPVTGHGLLESDRPFRASNGEATTFIYRLTATNTADYADTFRFNVDELPDQWTVTFPESELRLPGGESEEFPVLVNVPFAHDHGSVETIWINMTANSDPLALASLEVGVVYLAVPQPAGHHDTLYIHSSDGWPFMNTVQDYEFSTGDPSDPCCTASSLGSYERFSWYIGLMPGLQMGLDFDLERTGTFTLPIRSDLPMEDVFIYGTFTMGRCNFGSGFGGCERIDVATLEATEPVSLDAQSRHEFTSTIAPLEEADYLPIEEYDYQYLQLYLTLETSTVQAVNAGDPDMVHTEPLIMPGGWMQLPLDEFHDDVTGFYQALSGIELIPVGPQQKLVNAGETVLFEVEAHNEGANKDTFRLEVTGANSEWATVLGDLQVVLAPGEARLLAVSITPPSGAVDGDLVDITLHAAKADDANVRSLIRLLAEVDTEVDHEDEGAEANALDDELRTTPGPVLPLLGAAVLLMRRRFDQTV